MRLLHVTPSFGVGGAEVLVKNLLLSHDREKFDVAACSLFPRKGTELERELESNGIRIYYLMKQMGPDPRILPSLFHLFRAFQPHILHTHNYVIRYTLLPALLCRIPVKIHTVHNIAEKEVDLPGKLIHLFSFKIIGVRPIGISQEISKTVERLYKIKTVPFIYNGIPTERYNVNSFVRQEIRSSLAISDNQFVVIHIGRFSPQKNHRLLVESFARVASQRQDVTLLLVGDGALRMEIENLVKTKGLIDQVRFLGIRHDIPELLTASDLFVLSSDWEGLPLVVLEAMAAGKPIIATAVGGIPELIGDGQAGMLVRPGDMDSLAESMRQLYEDGETAKRFGEKAQEVVREKFDIRKTTAAYEDIYVDLLKGRVRH